MVLSCGHLEEVKLTVSWGREGWCHVPFVSWGLNEEQPTDDSERLIDGFDRLIVLRMIFFYNLGLTVCRFIFSK